MAPFLYRCPTTGLTVQAFHPDEAVKTPRREVYFGMQCLACSQTHLVNPTTGKVLLPKDE